MLLELRFVECSNGSEQLHYIIIVRYTTCNCVTMISLWFLFVMVVFRDDSFVSFELEGKDLVL